MPPTLADRVRHILEAIVHIEHSLADVEYQQFSDDLFLRLAIERLLEIISEASRKFQQNSKQLHPRSPGDEWPISAIACGTPIIVSNLRSSGASRTKISLLSRRS